MAKRPYDHLFKLLLIGDSGVGKTCLIFRFCEDIFQQSFISTIGIDFKIKTVEIGGKRIKLQIWDTAGQERFHTITVSYYRNAHGIFLVYDITRRESFENVTNWVRQVQQNAKEDVERMLIGNKADMEDQRQVAKERGKQLAMEFSMPFVETSCKTGENVEKAFLDMTMAILRRNPSGASAAQSAGSSRPATTVTVEGQPPNSSGLSARCC